MEEQQIRDFVHRISNDEVLRQQLKSNPTEVIKHEGFSPLVARVVARLVPHLTLDKQDGIAGTPSYTWWI